MRWNVYKLCCNNGDSLTPRTDDWELTNILIAKIIEMARTVLLMLFLSICLISVSGKKWKYMLWSWKTIIHVLILFSYLYSIEGR